MQLPTGKKPPGRLKIDRSHYLAKDLKVFLTVQDGAIVDLVSGRVFAQDSNTYVTKGLIQTGANGISYGTLNYNENEYLSVHGRFIYSVYSDAALIDIDNQSLILWTDNYLSYSLRPTLYTGATRYGANDIYDINESVVWGGNIKSSSSGGIYVDGVRVNYGSTGTKSVSSKNLTFFSNTSGYKDAPSLCEFVYIANRELSGAEVKALHNDPYQILKPAINLQDSVAVLFEEGGEPPAIPLSVLINANTVIKQGF